MLYKGDWKRDPQLSMCSPATRGIWIDLICDMDDLGCATITGTAKMLARMCRSSDVEVVEAFAELKASNAADIQCTDGIYTVTCRRVEKELHISKVRSDAVQNRYKVDTNESTKQPTNSLHPVEDENEVLAVEVVSVSKPKADCEGIYGAYPRKVARRAAFRAIEQAFQRIIAGEGDYKFVPDEANKFLRMAAEAFARSPDGMKGEFTSHPATWFNASRYLDDQQEWAKSASTGGSNGTHGTYKSKTESSMDAAHEAIRLIREAGADRDGADEAGYTPAGQAGYGGLPRLGSGSGLV